VYVVARNARKFYVTKFSIKNSLLNLNTYSYVVT